MGAAFVLDNEALAFERRYLLNYAMFKLRDTDLANDAVQDTLVAAMLGKDRFAGRSSLRTWLVAILRNKICDLLAARRGDVAVETIDAESDGEVTPESMFDGRGRWVPGATPQAWASPESALEQKQFWEVLQQCLARMPARVREVFVLREVMGEPIDAICRKLRISRSNCSVMLHRARMRLRLSLQLNWYDAGG